MVASRSELAEFLRIPSVSADPAQSGDRQQGDDGDDEDDDQVSGDHPFIVPDAATLVPGELGALLPVDLGFLGQRGEALQGLGGDGDVERGEV